MLVRIDHLERSERSGLWVAFGDSTEGKVPQSRGKVSNGCGPEPFAIPAKQTTCPKVADIHFSSKLRFANPEGCRNDWPLALLARIGGKVQILSSHRGTLSTHYLNN